jgi:hypothetical protein
MSADHKTSGESNQALGMPDIVARPRLQLRSLPIRYRWEVTRRHPYYQSLWLIARAHHRHEPLAHAADEYWRQIAVLILGMIGVSGDPPDPGKEFAELGEVELQSAWLSGAVHPITLRGLAGLLIAALPKETLGHVALQLLEAGRDECGSEPPRRHSALLNLAALDMPGLDSYPDDPIVAVNPAASGRQITEAVTELLKHWKAERGLAEKRDRSDKYPDYLQVWDLREGWTGRTYDITREKKLKEVAVELGLELSTVNNHYRNAFELIIGHPYSPGMWFRVFGVNKFFDFADGVLGPVTHHRPTVSPTRRPVPESVLGCASKEGDEISPSAEVRASHSFDVERLIEQIVKLLHAEPDDARIAERLELGPAAIPAIARLRERQGELK